MTNDKQITNSKPTKTILKISKARMPNNCWGTYENIAVITADYDREVKIIRTCRGQKVIWFCGPVFRGSSDRCAAEKAIDRALAFIKELQAPMRAQYK